MNAQAKIKTALRLSQEDQKTITHLQKEMEKTWKMVYMSQEKEGRAKENITLLKDELATLSRLVERGASLSVSQENDVKQLRLAREELQRQVEEQSVQIALLEGKLFEQNNYHVDLREQVAQHLATITDVKDRLASKESDSLREVKRRLKTQKELQDARILLEEKSKAQETLAMEVDVSKAQNIELQRQLQEAHTTMEKYLRDYDTLYNRTQKVTTDLELQANENRKLQVEHVAIDKEMKLRLAEIGRLKTENQLLERRVDTEHKTGLQFKQLAADAKNPLLEAHSEITKLKAELISLRRLESGLERKAETIAREKETQMKLHLRAEGKVKEQTELKMEQEKLAEDLGREVKESVEESLQLRKVIHQLDRDRERLVNELGEQKGINAKSLEDVKTKNMQISELHKNINDWETKLKQQQQLYERARSDRAHYSKNLIESQDEIAELLKKSKIMSQQIEQLKEEIQVKEEGMVKEHFEFQRADKLKDYLQNEVNDKNLLIRRNMELSQLQVSLCHASF